MSQAVFQSREEVPALGSREAASISCLIRYHRALGREEKAKSLQA